MTKFVVCKVSIPGFHRWPDAYDAVDFLRNRHRHVFVIEVGFAVTENDREVEIIDTQNKITNFLFKKYGNETGCECEFDSMACEDIACDIINNLGASWAKVTEDGFGGALIMK